MNSIPELSFDQFKLMRSELIDTFASIGIFDNTSKDNEFTRFIDSKAVSEKYINVSNEESKSRLSSFSKHEPKRNMRDIRESIQKLKKQFRNGKMDDDTNVRKNSQELSEDYDDDDGEEKSNNNTSKKIKNNMDNNMDDEVDEKEGKNKDKKKKLGRMGKDNNDNVENDNDSNDNIYVDIDEGWKYIDGYNSKNKKVKKERDNKRKRPGF
mmetsp:Transcript_28292/g.23728  ORF Transcript_28292/g.23728 Transcript_28292/m.23728 type:complete len:210 (+) Transcript_28292:2-631(+)